MTQDCPGAVLHVDDAEDLECHECLGESSP